MQSWGTLADVWMRQEQQQELFTIMQNTISPVLVSTTKISFIWTMLSNSTKPLKQEYSKRKLYISMWSRSRSKTRKARTLLPGIFCALIRIHHSTSSLDKGLHISQIYVWYVCEPPHKMKRTEALQIHPGFYHLHIPFYQHQRGPALAPCTSSNIWNLDTQRVPLLPGATFQSHMAAT